jgi:hypothetical protein
VEKDNNSTTLILWRNIMAHVYKPLIREQSIACHVFRSPEWFFKDNKSFQCISSQLIVKNNSFVFTDVGEINISDNLKWNCTNNLSCEYFKGFSTLLKTSNNDKVIKNIININDL